MTPALKLTREKTRRAALYLFGCSAIVALRGFGLATLMRGHYRLTSFASDAAALLCIMALLHLLYFALQQGMVRIGITNPRAQFCGRLLFVLFGALPFLVVTVQLHPQKIAPGNGPEIFGIPSTEVNLTTADQLTLRGWLLNPEGPKPPILFLHGLNANKANFLPISGRFAQLGYPVLTFDFRAHGESDSRLTTLGLLEGLDAQAGLEWLRGRYPGRRISAVAYSLGGAALLSAAARGAVPDRAVIDSTYAVLQNVATARLLSALGPLQRPAYGLLGFWADTVSGVPLSSLDLRPGVQRFSPGSLLLVAGTNDQMISASESRLLQQAASPPPTMWEIPQAGHLQTVTINGYYDRLCAFLDEKTVTETEALKR